MPEAVKQVIVLAGPNGAGKSTVSEAVVHGVYGIDAFVNADTLARGLRAFDVERVAVDAGRIMLEWLTKLARRGERFAFETTLSGRTWSRHIERWRADGYEVGIIYVWIPSAEVSVQRVTHRREAGGHYIDPEVVRRRYERGLGNFWNFYRRLADWWEIYDNETGETPRPIAHDKGDGVVVEVPEVFTEFLEMVTHGQADAD